MIKQFLTKMFSEHSNISSMRVMAFVSLVAGIGVAAFGIAKGSDLYGLSALAGVFVGAAFGGKVSQKFAEIKKGNENVNKKT